MKTYKFYCMILLVSALLGCNKQATLATVETGSFTTFPDTKLVQCGGTVVTDGGAMVYARGICYVKGSGTPTVENQCAEGGSGKGTFQAVLEYINVGEEYTYCAYAINEAGVAYGTPNHFTMEVTPSSGGGGDDNPGDTNTTMGNKVDEFVGTYTCSAYDVDDQKYVTWSNVKIFTWVDSEEQGEWIAVSGLNEGFDDEAALGKYDATNKCLRLYAQYRFSDYTYKFEDKLDTLFFSSFYPIYAPKDGSSWHAILNGDGYNGSGEAWLTFDSNGDVVLGAAKTPDSENFFANGFNFAAYYNDDGKLFGWYHAFIEVKLTKTSSSASVASTKMPRSRMWHAPMLIRDRRQINTRPSKSVARQ